MAKRVLAILGAVAMVLTATVVRRALDDDGSGDEGPDGGDGAVVLICADDLAEAVCDGLRGVDVIRQDAAETAAAIASGDLPAGADGWVTTSAWTEVVASRAQVRLDGVEALATTPVVVAVDPARTGAVADLCGSEPVWRCLGDHSGQDWQGLGGELTWGSLKVGLPSADTATGLAVLASVASGFFGDADFASNDFTDFEGWLATLARPSGGGEVDPVRTLVTTRGKYSAVGATQAALVGRAADPLAATPAVATTAVLVDLPDGDRLPAAQGLRDRLTDAGWQAAAGEPTPTLKPGVMAALHTLWTEVTR